MNASAPTVSTRGAGAWIHPRRTLNFTRDGWFFLAITMAIGFASLNTGHNLFYLVFAMQVSLIVVSGILSERSLKSLSVERRMPRDLFAGAATSIEIVVTNASARRMAYAIEVWDCLDSQPNRRVGFLDRLEPRHPRCLPMVWEFENRGAHVFHRVLLITRFPFGLFEKTRILPLRQEVVVYPAVDRGQAARSAFDRENAALRKHRLGDETIGFRRHLPGDDRRAIHWRVSARVGELMVRDPGEAPNRPVSVFFDVQGVPGVAFEAAVRRAATIIWQTCGAGQRLDFYAEGCVALSVGRDSWHEPLEFLACVDPHDEPSGEALAAWRQAAAQGRGVFVTSTDPPPIPAGTLLRVA